MSMLVWLTLLFYDFCVLRSVAVNSVYKLQFFTFIQNEQLDQVDMFIYLGSLFDCPNKQSDFDPIPSWLLDAHLFLTPQSLTSSTSLSLFVSFIPFSKNLSFVHCLRSLP